MNLQQFLQQFFGNVNNAVTSAAQAADDARQKLFFVVLLAIMHFGVLVGGHAVLQWISPGPFSVYNSLWGAFWVCSLMIGGIMFGGLPLHAVLIANAAGNEGAHTTTRVLVGFCAIETIVNVFFAFVPIMTGDPLAWAAFLTLPSAVGCYFLYRHMAGIPIKWGRWAKVPLVNILLALITMIVQYVRVTYADTIASATGSASGFSFSFLAHPGFWLIALVAAGLVWSLKGGSSHASH